MPRNIHKNETSIFTLPQDAIQEDRGLKTCGVPQLVLASVSDVVSYKNDRTAIAYKFDTMTIELEDSSGVVTSAAGVAVSFPYQTDAKGYVIDWRQVVDGGGLLAQDCYKVRVNWTLSGNSGWFYHGAYQLQEYSVFNARGTTRLYVVLNDLVRKQGINYKDSGFAGTVRFEGIFGFMQPNYDTENNTHTNRERFKVRNEALRTYELRTSYLLRCMTRLIDEETLLAPNQIYVTDHNAANHDQSFYDFPVILSEEESPSFEYPTGSVYAKITAKFLDKVAYHESKYDGDITGSENVILQLPTAVASCSPASYTVEYDNGTPIESGTIPSGGSATISVPDVITLPLGARIMPTGAEETGGVDDGREVDFFTLDGTNYFGSDRRFTGITGGYYDRLTTTWRDVLGVATTRALAYPNDLVCDWSTVDVNNDFTMYVCDLDYIIASLSSAITILSTATIGSFNAFKVANINEGANIQFKGINFCVGYEEMYDISSGFAMHTSTPTTSGVNLSISTYYATQSEVNSLSSLRCCVCRTTNTSEL